MAEKGALSSRLVVAVRSHLLANGDWNVNDWKGVARQLADEADELRDALRGIAVTTAWDGPDGTSSSWVHWAEQARRALGFIDRMEKP